MLRPVAIFVVLLITMFLFSSCQPGDHKADSHQFQVQQSVQQQQAANTAGNQCATAGSETFYPKQP